MDFTWWCYQRFPHCAFVEALELHVIKTQPISSSARIQTLPCSVACWCFACACVCVHRKSRYLTHDAHAQRGLRCFVLVCPSVLCLLLHVRLYTRNETTKQRYQRVHRCTGFVLKGDFRITTYSVPSISGTARSQFAEGLHSCEPSRKYYFYRVRSFPSSFPPWTPFTHWTPWNP